MFYALNKDSVRIAAYEANKEEAYKCPICNNPVILKRGGINSDHFAHVSNVCEDNWNYDMSEWHKRMQNNFPKETQEVVVSHCGKKHRADVLIDDIVLEFQFSPITAAEYEERNEFFKNAGYRLAWIFNLSQISRDQLYHSEEKDNMMIWKYPMRIFAKSDDLGEHNKRFALWFSFCGDIEFERDGEEYIDRVIWAIKDDNGYYSMQRFFVSDNEIVMDGKSVVNPNYFFYSKWDYFNDKYKELKNKYAFSVKYKNEKGKHRESYMCPRKNGEFGIEISGERGCYYCKYCYMVARKEYPSETIYRSYCCYPTQVRELCEGHFGYECLPVDIFDI